MTLLFLTFVHLSPPRLIPPGLLVVSLLYEQLPTSTSPYPSFSATHCSSPAPLSTSIKARLLTDIDTQAPLLNACDSSSGPNSIAAFTNRVLRR